MFDRRRLLIAGGALFSLIFAIGVMGSNGWLPHTDALSGKKYGWFGKELPKNITSSVWNPVALTTPTPQLSKEYIYAGSRLLAVEDANANAVPPADLAIWRPSDGNWWVLGGPGSAQTNYHWGMSGDVPVPGDFDGDGKTDFAIFRPSDGSWWVTNSSTGTGNYVATWGASTDIPVAADFDGDGKTDIAVWRPSPAAFWIQQSSDGARYNVTYGSPGDLPAPADYDGDGKADIAIFSNSTPGFIWKSSRDGQVYTQVWGAAGDKPIAGDYDGDGKADFAVIHVDPSTSQWYWNIRRSSDGVQIYVPWGDSNDGDIAVQNDYDGDGKVDLAVWRSSNGYWFIYQSSGGYRIQQWGMPGDIPVPAYYRR